MPEYTDAHGIAIVYDRYDAIGEARGVVQLAHGVGEHAGRYALLIAALQGEGWIVYADDHRGHGRTGMRQWGGDVSKLGRLGPGGLRATIAALAQFTELIRAENPTLPLVLLGHSWGSLMSQELIAQHAERYDAVILSGSAQRTFTGLNAQPLNRRWDGPDAHGLEWLCSLPEVWEEFRNDPLTTETPLPKLFGIPDTLRIRGRAGVMAKDLPVLLMVGSEDPVGGPRSVHKLADDYRTRSKLTDVTVYVYPGDRHEIFNEVDQEKVRADLLAWLEARFPRD
ncbi:alpha/beta fold hydrolase [Microbacterium sp. ZW T5_56]|uniref:alpha/beta fold hydrolase n=1 Tax=Microbacterium sp. ZW T5_56 TaxID=3378081 RepID=UPI003853A1F4